MNSGHNVYHNVLTVEDEPLLRRVIVQNLRSRGLQVREAASAEQAVQEIIAECPELLLLDINLPDRSGWDVLREIRMLGISVSTIVVSAVRVNPSRLKEFRPLAYLIKPFPLEALLNLVVSRDQEETIARAEKTTALHREESSKLAEKRSEIADTLKPHDI